ncbi:MAG TPA: DUF4331 domain-containing protein [Terriglobia bacterium]|nr:DUF4331 domain-containing protein [Terriglobia bacterium]
MRRSTSFLATAIALGALLILTVGVVLVPDGLLASSHREAPITALDQKADITDLYAFRSYDAAGNDTSPPTITMILCVDPFLEPANGPNWFPFDPTLLYEIKVDNDEDGLAEVIFQFRFQTQIQLPTVYTGLAGFDGANNGTGGVIPPRIEDFNNPGLSLRQTYTVNMITNGHVTPIANSDGSPFYAVPANAGPRTIRYRDLYQAGTYSNAGGSGISVFAGTVDDPFFIDLGGTFDTANYRAGTSGIPGVMSASDDAANANFAADTVSGFAVNAIAIQVPIWMLTSTGKVEAATSPNATIGIWGSTSRAHITIRRSPQPAQDFPKTNDPIALDNNYKQIQRLGNPLINELIIGTGSKDYWSMSQPVNDSQFASFDLNPPFVTIVDALVQALLPGALTSPPAPRTDLLPLVTYAPPIAAPGTPAGPIADLLRINTGVPPTPPGSASRLGLVGGDAAGWPNGRRLADDVVDIALRVVVGGVAAGKKCGVNHDSNCAVFPNTSLGDGVNVNDVNINLATDGVTNLVEPNTHFHTSFPYLDYCPSGRNRRHIDPGEPGCTGSAGPPCEP